MTDYDPTRGIPPAEIPILRKLVKAEVTFRMQVEEMAMEDEAMLAHITEIYRQAVEEAAAQGVEIAGSWHTLATWTKEGKERIGYFSRALECIESRRDELPDDHIEIREFHYPYLRAECLLELGRDHAHEGDPSVAREFLLRALPHAKEVERLAVAAGVTGYGRLEGRIAELLVQLPDDGDKVSEPPE
ncbi:MAG: hypothetical protein QOF07_2803 [Bradyrhizobium sp.]|nr:hypothetical protein [Bradyrhizobium sp.]